MLLELASVEISFQSGDVLSVKNARWILEEEGNSPPGACVLFLFFFSLDAHQGGACPSAGLLAHPLPWCAVHLAQSSSSLAESFLLIRVYLLTVGQLYQGTA